MLKIDRINCYYGHVQVLRDFSLDLAPGEVLCLLGRNGPGKKSMPIRPLIRTSIPRAPEAAASICGFKGFDIEQESEDASDDS